MWTVKYWICICRQYLHQLWYVSKICDWDANNRVFVHIWRWYWIWYKIHPPQSTSLPPQNITTTPFNPTQANSCYDSKFFNLQSSRLEISKFLSIQGNFLSYFLCLPVLWLMLKDWQIYVVECSYKYNVELETIV